MGALEAVGDGLHSLVPAREERVVLGIVSGVVVDEAEGMGPGKGHQVPPLPRPDGVRPDLEVGGRQDRQLDHRELVQLEQRGEVRVGQD